MDEIELETLIADPSMATCLCIPLSFVIQVVEGSSYVPIKFLSTLLVSPISFLARTLLPGAPILGSADFYIGQVNLQPLYDRLKINNQPLHLCTTRLYPHTR
ncbi:hypothetical protein INT45_003500 [Circinella minor]|uniref:Uncharacterized protein n=1 Tax=Circinella minor TaxID=1195481 RepID=A0A8H7VI46_9FUNG|nr:hypothetical protein INT45_003500 [Circinella minor]